MNKIIAISGSSGVGKTTISRLISIALPNEKTLVFSGDDLHRWERGDSNWNTHTHLDPEANNLFLGYEHLKTLKSNDKVVHHSYNHDTGRFESSVNVYPAKFIVYEGLHALYDVRVRDMSWIKIFVDTDEDLKKEWKIERDTKKRGYTKEQVEDVIKRRSVDERKHINPQRKHADVIIKFKKIDGEVILTYELVNNKAKELMGVLDVVYKKHFSFIDVCNSMANEFDLVQSRGGNVSYKINDKLVITSSGSRMKDISTFSGNCVCNTHLLSSYFDTDDVYRNKLFESKLFESNERPSMETGMHYNLERDIIHTHPIYLNTILCSKEAELVIGILFKDLDYEFVSYSTPGVDLSNAIGSYRQSSVYFLENHGLVVCSDDIRVAYKTTKYISDKCKEWLMGNITNFHSSFDDSTEKTNEYLFPDAVALSDENLAVNNYMIKTINNAGLTPKFLMKKEIEKIQNMESEKYRSQLV